MQIIQATCKYPGGQPRVSQSGREYVSGLFIGPDGQEHRVYAPPAGQTTAALQQLQQGQTVTLALDSRGKAHLCLPDEQTPMGFQSPAPVAPSPVVPQPVVQQQQAPAYQAQPQAPVAVPAAGGDRAIAAADVLATIYRRLIEQGVPESVAGPMSSTAFIQLSRG